EAVSQLRKLGLEFLTPTRGLSFAGDPLIVCHGQSFNRRNAVVETFLALLGDVFDVNGPCLCSHASTLSKHARNRLRRCIRLGVRRRRSELYDLGARCALSLA